MVKLGETGPESSEEERESREKDAGPLDSSSDSHCTERSKELCGTGGSGGEVLLGL